MFSVIFEVHPGPGRKDEYLGHAKALTPILRSMDGFIDNERFEDRGRPGWVLSHSTWRDEKAVIRWRTAARHHLVQRTGRRRVFSDYHLRVGEVTADTHPPPGVAVREQRFDETEAGRAKLCTLLEIAPAAAHRVPGARDGLLRAIGLHPRPPGLEEVAVYDSIYDAGKVLVLGGWAGPGDAAGWDAGPLAGAAGVRRRAVRVIRDYGMFDRRESPQYYPDAPRDGGAAV